jgi:hypothetical protein
MDADSARKANLLVGNEEGAPVLELLSLEPDSASWAWLSWPSPEPRSNPNARSGGIFTPRPVAKLLLAASELGFGLI